MAAHDDIVAFDRNLQKLVGESDERPFLCQGSPFGCEIFLVGINPRTDTPFRRYWSMDRGCDKGAWLEAYLEKHGRFGPTRARIERLSKALEPVRILETNVFHRRSDREAKLAKSDRTTGVFEFLLRELRPRILFVHGRSAVTQLERLTSTSIPRGEFTSVRCQDVSFDVFAGHHLSYRWSYAAVEQLGYTLRERCIGSHVT